VGLELRLIGAKIEINSDALTSGTHVQLEPTGADLLSFKRRRGFRPPVCLSPLTGGLQSELKRVAAVKIEYLIANGIITRLRVAPASSQSALTRKNPENQPLLTITAYSWRARRETCLGKHIVLRNQELPRLVLMQHFLRWHKLLRICPDVPRSPNLDLDTLDGWTSASCLQPRVTGRSRPKRVAPVYEECARQSTPLGSIG
jgi:hypothetical protein